MTGPAAVNTDLAQLPFAAILQQIEAGAAHTEVTQALTDVTAAVMRHGKKGAVKLTVEVAPLKENPRVLTVTVTVATSKPAQPKVAIFYGTVDGILSRTDPHQPTLPGTVSLVKENPA